MQKEGRILQLLVEDEVICCRYCSICRRWWVVHDQPSRQERNPVG